MMDALMAALQQGGLSAWLVLIAGLAVGLILLRVIFEVASVAIRVGCAVLFLLGTAYLLYTFLGAG
jgi:hypothetical protein